MNAHDPTPAAKAALEAAGFAERKAGLWAKNVKVADGERTAFWDLRKPRAKFYVGGGRDDFLSDAEAHARPEYLGLRDALLATNVQEQPAAQAKAATEKPAPVVAPMPDDAALARRAAALPHLQRLVIHLDERRCAIVTAELEARRAVTPKDWSLDTSVILRDLPAIIAAVAQIPDDCLPKIPEAKK